MKFKFNIKEKEASFDADVERIVEKGLDYKFQNPSPQRKTRYQIKQEEKRKNKEQEQKQFLQGIFAMIAIIIVILIICGLGSLLIA